MKNEKLARAISDIDDELIEEAHGDMLRRRMPLAKKLTAVAACLWFGTGSLPLECRCTVWISQNAVR